MAALSKRGGAPRDRCIWSTTSTPPNAARAASTNRALLAGNGELPPRVTRATSRSADQTKGFASGTRWVWSSTSRTPGTASTEATALRRPSSENASAARSTSRPNTSIRVLSSTVSFNAALARAPRSDSRGVVLVQAAIIQKTTRIIVPGHHLLLHLKSPRIRCPAGVWELRENKPLRGCQTRNNRGGHAAQRCPTNCLFSDFPLVSHLHPNRPIIRE